jgi:hypothetical protein
MNFSIIDLEVERGAEAVESSAPKWKMRLIKVQFKYSECQKLKQKLLERWVGLVP